FIGCNLASELIAGRTEKVTVGLRNLGPESWKAGRDRIAVHWYYMDGAEAAWQDSSAPLPDDVPPFSEVAIRPPAASAAPPRSPTPNTKHQTPNSEPATPNASYKVVLQQTIIHDVPVQVPHYFGPMYCVFDLIHDGQP